MKKALKRIFTLVCAVALLAAPSTALAYSNSTPVLTLDVEGIKVFSYQPAPYELNANQSEIFSETTKSDGRWVVPAGKNFVVGTHITTEDAYYRIRIFNSTNDVVYDSDVTTGAFHQVYLPISSVDEKYQIWITAYSDLAIRSYDGYVYK